MPDRPIAPANNSGIAIQLLGGFSVSINQQPIPEDQWKSRRVRSLVKLLALAPDHRLHRERVLDALWPDSDLTAAANNLHQTLFTARKIFETSGVTALFLQDSLLSLGNALSVDVDQFETAAARAANSQDPALFQAALDLYPGDLLPDDLYEEWSIQRRDSLRQLHLRLLLDLARLLESRQDYLAGIETLRQVLTIDRAHEEAHAGLMRLNALSGQRQPALRQFQTLKAVLRTELEAEPSPATLRLYADIQSGRLAQPARLAEPAGLASTEPNPRKHNLPAHLTAFIGRETEIADLSEKLKSSRLVTLTGSGGTGKTRLALQVAAQVLDTFPDGVWLVELAPLADPALVPPACLQVLELVQQPGVSPASILSRFLEHKHALLILDNCEHLLTACTRLVNDLVKACPQLHILASSREILSVPGETPFRVPSLAFPDPRSLPTPAEMAQFEAVQLFEVRSKQASPGFHLTPEGTRAVAQICSRLDGIPLAIELAAARMHVLSVDQLAARLDNTFRILTGGSKAVLPRQQTLKATIDWSYDLLTPNERLLLQRLSAFAGGWSLEAAEAVCADAQGAENAIGALDVIDWLAQLVDKSLVVAARQKDGVRYHLLETIRQYARDRLMETGSGVEVRVRHLAYFARLSGDAEPHLRGKGQIEWLERMDQELDNLRAALEWSLSSRVDLGLKIAADLMWFWHIRALFNEAFEWLEKLIGAEAEQHSKQAVSGEIILQRARGLRALAYQINYLNKPRSELIPLLQESIAILRAIEPLPRRELGISLFYYIFFQNLLNQPSLIREEMLNLFRLEDEKFYLSEYNWFTAAYTKDWNHLIDIGNTGMAISREIEDWDGICSWDLFLGCACMLKGDYTMTKSLFTDAIEISRKVKNYWFEANLYNLFSTLSLVQGNYEEAVNYSELSLLKYRQINYVENCYGPLQTLQEIYWSQGNYDQSFQYGQEIVTSFSGNESSEVSSYLYLGRVAISQGDLSQAVKYLRKTLISNLWENYPAIWAALPPHLLAWISLFRKQGKYLISASLIGAVDSVYQQTSSGLIPRERSEFIEDLASTRAALDEGAFGAAFAKGQAMSLEQAIGWVADEMQVQDEL